MIPKAVTLCVAIQVADSLRVTCNECGVLEQVVILLVRMLWTVSIWKPKNGLTTRKQTPSSNNLTAVLWIVVTFQHCHQELGFLLCLCSTIFILGSALRVSLLWMITKYCNSCRQKTFIFMTSDMF